MAKQIKQKAETLMASYMASLKNVAQLRKEYNKLDKAFTAVEDKLYAERRRAEGFLTKLTAVAERG